MRREGGIRCLKQMVPFIEDKARRLVSFFAQRRLNQHQCVIGNDQLRPSGAALTLFDEALR